MYHIFCRTLNYYTDNLPTVMSRLECDSLPVTCITPGPGMTVAVQVYVPEDVACNDGISSVILYSPAEATMVVLLPPGPARLPVTVTSLSTTAGSSRMVQVRVRLSSW